MSFSIHCGQSIINCLVFLETGGRTKMSCHHWCSINIKLIEGKGMKIMECITPWKYKIAAAFAEIVYTIILLVTALRTLGVMEDKSTIKAPINVKIKE